METMRELLRQKLGRSLKAFPEVDRLRAAWTVACGKAMAEHGRITSFESGILTIEASDTIWLVQMLSMRAMLERDLARIAEVKLGGIHFCLGQNAGSERR